MNRLRAHRRACAAVCLFVLTSGAAACGGNPTGPDASAAALPLLDGGYLGVDHGHSSEPAPPADPQDSGEGPQS